MDLKMSAKCYVFLHMDPSYIMGKNCSIYGSQKILGLACTLKNGPKQKFSMQLTQCTSSSLHK